MDEGLMSASKGKEGSMYFLEGKLVMIGVGISGELPPDLVERYAEETTSLDCSENELSDMYALESFTLLKTLVADRNHLSSHSRWPVLPGVETLWLNYNIIENLPTFIEKLERSFPNLRYLSLLGNACTPNFLNGGTPKQYADYRHFVIAHLPKLIHLDASEVTAAEREDSRRVYAKTKVVATDPAGRGAKDFGPRAPPKKVKKKKKHQY